MRLFIIVLIKVYVGSNTIQSGYLARYISGYLDRRYESGQQSTIFKPTLHSTILALREFVHGMRFYASKSDSDRILSGIEETVVGEILGVNSPNGILLIVNDTAKLVGGRVTESSEDKSHLSPRSSIGQFVLNTTGIVNLLHFDELTILYKSLCRFREEVALNSTQTNLEANSPHSLISNKGSRSRMDSRFQKHHSGSSCLEDTSFSEEISENDLRFYDTMNKALLKWVPYGPDDLGNIHDGTDIDRMIESQISFLEQLGPTLGSAVKANVRRSAQFHSSLLSGLCCNRESNSSLCYLQYLEFLHAKRYHQALDSLHRYFDYMVSKGSRYFYHFALVSKASLHRLFGEDRKSLDSMEEAISIARENKDTATLTYILSWLYQLLQDQPRLLSTESVWPVHNGLMLLDILIKKSSMVSISLAVLSYRYETDYALKHFEHFACYYESHFKAGYLSLNDDVASFIEVSASSRDVWQRAGFKHLRDLYSDVSRSCIAIFASNEEIMEKKISLTDNLFNAVSCEQNMVQVKVPSVQVPNTGNMMTQVESHLKNGSVALAGALIKQIPRDNGTIASKLSRLEGQFAASCGEFKFSSEITNHVERNQQQLTTNPCIIIQTNMTKAVALTKSDLPLRGSSLLLHQAELAGTMGFSTLLGEAILLFIRMLNTANITIDATKIAFAILPMIKSLSDLKLESMLFYELALACYAIFRADNQSRSLEKREMFSKTLQFLGLSITGHKKLRDYKLLNRCFQLEQSMARATTKGKKLREYLEFSELETHSRKALDASRSEKVLNCNSGFMV